MFRKAVASRALPGALGRAMSCVSKLQWRTLGCGFPTVALSLPLECTAVVQHCSRSTRLPRRGVRKASLKAELGDSPRQVCLLTDCSGPDPTGGWLCLPTALTSSGPCPGL